MIVIGLTGLIGSGKSTVLNFFKNFGAQIFSCDDYVKYLNEDENVIAAIKQYFPETIINNKIDKIILKNVVFKDYKNNIKILEDIYHPYVIAKIKSLINKKSLIFWKILVLEVPLLFEAGLDKFCKYTILVNCDESVRISRVKERSFIEDEDLQKIINKQGSSDSKFGLVDFVIDTNSSFASIEVQVKNVVKKVKFGFSLFK